MAGPGAGATQGVIFGGFLCFGVCLVAIAACVILSIISTFPPNRSQAGFGSEYLCDSGMLKFSYENFTYRFSNGVVGNSTALSDAATVQLESQGVQYVAGVLLYNGRAWDAANTSNSSRRRRRQSAASQAGMYYTGTFAIYFTDCCPGGGNRNKTANSTRTSACVRVRITQANNLFGGTSATFLAWGSTNRVIIEVQDTTGAFQSIAVNQIFGVPRTLAVPIANNLANLSTNAGTRGELQRGCRFSRALPIATINAILASQTSSNTLDATTVAG